VVVGVGARRAVDESQRILDNAETAVPTPLRGALRKLLTEIRDLEERIEDIERELRLIADDDTVAIRLMSIPGVGVLTATAFLASVGHIHGFRRGRQFASWLGLTPREHSSGPRRVLGGITKQGNVYLRCLLTHGARSVLVSAHRAKLAKRRLNHIQEWALAVADRRGHNRAAIAVANKMARVAWVVWTRDVAFDPTFTTQSAAA
jgi:transposase